jgi:hypothetical protein
MLAMSPGDPVAVRTASTPAQAQVFTAILNAEGIHAHVDDGAAPAVFGSGMYGVRVMVPACDLERARDLLANTAVDPTELEAQALATDVDRDGLRGR